ncbi:lipopolysaccharide assembly protein LapA domain-containing protein [Corynebacterium sp. H128]|uniref:LapA family protein n=1 Tax=unclassified Corynebacterium TaxID=2624378 RepID=UPI0030A1D8A6
MTTPNNDDLTQYDAQPDDASQPQSAPATDVEKRVEPKQTKPTKVNSSLAGGTWVALIFGALLLILLLVFIMQNQQKVDLNLFMWTFQFPAGIGFLLSAISGALIMALVGGVRMLELRRQVKKAYKS